MHRLDHYYKAHDLGVPLEISISGYKSYQQVVALEHATAQMKGYLGDWQRCPGRTKDDLRPRASLTFPSASKHGLPDDTAAIQDCAKECCGWIIGSELLLEGDVPGTFSVT